MSFRKSPAVALRFEEEEPTRLTSTSRAHVVASAKCELHAIVILVTCHGALKKR